MWFLVQSVRAEGTVGDSPLVVWEPEGWSSSRGLAESCRANSEVALPKGPEGCDGSRHCAEVGPGKLAEVVPPVANGDRCVAEKQPAKLTLQT